MDTKGLYITRKRKKWKFAHFDEWSNCFPANEVQGSTWPAFFGNTQPLIVEIGAGTADLSVALAAKQPRDHFVAVDVKSDRLYTGAKFAREQKLENIAFLRGRINDIDQLFTPASIKELWITFPDPFPRKRQAKHRLTHPRFLRQYAELLAPGGLLRFKTDNRELFLWSLEQLVGEKWHLSELSFDLHESNLPADYKITTAFERRFMKMGAPIYFVSGINNCCH